jgi:hypothetical protein
MHANTDDLGRAIVAQQETDLLAMLQRQSDRIAELEDASATMLAEKDDVIRQLIEGRREDAITIARLRVGRENDAALTRAVAQRDAREYAASMQRTAEYQR